MQHEHFILVLNLMLMFTPTTKPKYKYIYKYIYVNTSQHFPITGVIHWHNKQKGGGKEYWECQFLPITTPL